MNLKSLYQSALDHRILHDCSAHPYEEGDRLIKSIQLYQPKSVLEIGTGIGYTATIMALSAPLAHITTIEKDAEHVALARQFFAQNKVSKQITLINETAEIFLPNLKEQFDFIFFDGYQIHYEFLIQYERLLKKEGILFLGNNHLKSRTSDMFFEELQDESRWKILEKFSETTIAKRIS